MTPSTASLAIGPNLKKLLVIKSGNVETLAPMTYGDDIIVTVHNTAVFDGLFQICLAAYSNGTDEFRERFDNSENPFFELVSRTQTRFNASTYKKRAELVLTCSGIKPYVVEMPI